MIGVPQPLSVPTQGRTVASVAEPIATKLRVAARLLGGGASLHSDQAFRALFETYDRQESETQLDPELVGWALVGMWAVARVSEPNTELDLLSAEELFFRDFPRTASLSASIEGSTRTAAQQQLATVEPNELLELLPYVLERHGPGTRRSVLRDPADVTARDAKKQSGIFYTPSDVADYVISITDLGGSATVIDPACGTGVFLLAMLRSRVRSGNALTVLSSLYGVDVDAFAVQAAAFVLTAECLRHNAADVPAKLWHSARLNLAVHDSLDLPLTNESSDAHERRVRSEARLEARERAMAALTRSTVAMSRRSPVGPFPEVEGGFRSVVANPPYAPLGVRSDFDRLASRFETLRHPRPTAATNSFVPFVELMWRLGARQSKACMVVPMSIGYNSSGRIRALREAIGASSANWTFRFFDRTPDALFGDDVKQRIAIVSRDTTEPGSSICTSALKRWSSVHRRGLFMAMPRPVLLRESNISAGIPKIGSEDELGWYEALRKRRGRLSKFVSRESDGTVAYKRTVGIGMTAYNWFVLYREALARPDPTRCQWLRTASDDVADWLYAVLASRLTYWLWRVDGDGFHVPWSFVAGLPYAWAETDLDRELASAGRRLWSEAQKAPVRSINRGRVTISYRLTGLPSLDLIDSLVVESLGLPSRTKDWIAQYAEVTRAAGRRAVGGG